MTTIEDHGAIELAADAPPTRAQIVALEQALRAMPQAAIVESHDFAPGLYLRTITIPAGVALTGKVHATEHVFILSRGTLLVATEDGRREIAAPFHQVCRPGLKRVGYALTECVVTNVHITAETDLAKLEAELIEAEALPAPDMKESPWLG